MANITVHPGHPGACWLWSLSITRSIRSSLILIITNLISNTKHMLAIFRASFRVNQIVVGGYSMQNKQCLFGSDSLFSHRLSWRLALWQSFHLSPWKRWSNESLEAELINTFHKIIRMHWCTPELQVSKMYTTTLNESSSNNFSRIFKNNIIVEHEFRLQAPFWSLGTTLVPSDQNGVFPYSLLVLRYFWVNRRKIPQNLFCSTRIYSFHLLRKKMANF